MDNGSFIPLAYDVKSESEIQQLIQIEGPRYGCLLLRNNSGAFKNEQGQWVRFGLGHTSPKSLKSSDLIGITTITITPEMVGKQVGIFTAVEVKAEDWKPTDNERENSQRQFIAWVKLRGGISTMCNSVEDFIKIM